jgi:hypothetical protein
VVEIDISGHLYSDGHFPHLDWQSLQGWIDQHPQGDEQDEARDYLARQWLERLTEVFPDYYRVDESRHHQLMAPESFPGRGALRLAEECRQFMLRTFPGLEPIRQKVPILIWHDVQTYYQYIAPFFPEGWHGGSSGVHIRECECPHVALWGRDLNKEVDQSLVHELTHASLIGRELPLWLEEGVTQLVEQALAGRQPLQLTTKMAAAHKRYWRRFGLQAFWDGSAFTRPSRGQEAAYKLSEVLLLTLLSDYQPRWFGLVRGHQAKLAGFLSTANASDAGEAAAQKHLGMSVADLAARYLGPGPWTPAPINRSPSENEHHPSP